MFPRPVPSTCCASIGYDPHSGCAFETCKLLFVVFHSLLSSSTLLPHRQEGHETLLHANAHCLVCWLCFFHQACVLTLSPPLLRSFGSTVTIRFVKLQPVADGFYRA